MYDHISFLEKLYTWRGALLHSRIWPVWVLGIAALVAGWLFDSDFKWAFWLFWVFAFLSLVMFVWQVWPGYAILSHKQRRQARSLENSGKWPEAYQIHQKLNRSAVFPWEKVKAKLDLAAFFYEVGDFKKVAALASDLAHCTKDLSSENHMSWTLIQTVQMENLQNYNQALACWNSLLESVSKSHLKMLIHNNRGRIYTFLHKLDFAQIEYEKAYELFKQKPQEKYFSVVLHNLLLNYARQGLLKKAESLISEYQSFLAEDKHEHLLEFANNLLYAGREANHQKWIDQAYDIQLQVEPQTEEEFFALELSELRMRLNDQRAFRVYYDQIKPALKTKLEQPKFDLDKKLFIHRELIHVLQAQIHQKQDVKMWQDDLNWLAQQSERWVTLLDEYLMKVDTGLVNEKVRLLKTKQSLLKDKLMFEANSTQFEKTIKELVKLQLRVIEEWQSVDNVQQRVLEQIILVDDGISYAVQTRNSEKQAIVIEAFKESLEKALDGLLAWSLSLKTFRGQEDRIIFIAGSLIKLRHNTEQAKKLMITLDEEPFSLQHYAWFVKQQYQSIRLELFGENN